MCAAWLAGKWGAFQGVCRQPVGPGCCVVRGRWVLAATYAPSEPACCRVLTCGVVAVPYCKGAQLLAGDATQHTGAAVKSSWAGLSPLFCCCLLSDCCRRLPAAPPQQTRLSPARHNLPRLHTLTTAAPALGRVSRPPPGAQTAPPPACCPCTAPPPPPPVRAAPPCCAARRPPPPPARRPPPQHPRRPLPVPASRLRQLTQLLLLQGHLIGTHQQRPGSCCRRRSGSNAAAAGARRARPLLLRCSPVPRGAGSSCRGGRSGGDASCQLQRSCPRAGREQRKPRRQRRLPPLQARLACRDQGCLRVHRPGPTHQLLHGWRQRAAQQRGGASDGGRQQAPVGRRGGGWGREIVDVAPEIVEGAQLGGLRSAGHVSVGWDGGVVGVAVAGVGLLGCLCGVEGGGGPRWAWPLALIPHPRLRAIPSGAPP